MNRIKKKICQIKNIRYSKDDGFSDIPNGYICLFYPTRKFTSKKELKRDFCNTCNKLTFKFVKCCICGVIFNLHPILKDLDDFYCEDCLQRQLTEHDFNELNEKENEKEMKNKNE